MSMMRRAMCGRPYFSDSSTTYTVSGYTSFTSSDTSVITVQGSGSNSRYVVAQAGTVTLTATWAGETATLSMASGNDRVLVTAVSPYTSWSSSSGSTFQAGHSTRFLSAP